MRELLQRFQLLRPEQPRQLTLTTSQQLRSQATVPARRPYQSPGLVWTPGLLNQYQTKKYTRTPKDLVKLSKSALPSRAINMLRKNISTLEYGIKPITRIQGAAEKKKNQEAATQIRQILDHPNYEDDFDKFIGQIVEDILIFDAGCWEYVTKPKNIDGNDKLGLFPVCGASIALNPKWAGDPKTPRWGQVINGSYAEPDVKFLDSELEYIMLRKRSGNPFGISPLETVVEIMDAWLSLSSYQREVASQAYPAIMLYLGNEVTDDDQKIFKQYWQSELAGRGQPGFFGNYGTQKPESIQLKAAGDEGLYLAYQEMLVKTLAFAFDLKPQDFGLEKDSNKSTADVGQQSSIEEARRPLAQGIASRINRRLVPKAATAFNNPNISQQQFFWIGINPKDELKEAQIDAYYLDRDVYQLDEVREKLDRDPLPNGKGQMTKTEYQATVSFGSGTLLPPDSGPPSPGDQTLIDRQKAKQ